MTQTWAKTESFSLKKLRNKFEQAMQEQLHKASRAKKRKTSRTTKKRKLKNCTKSKVPSESKLKVENFVEDDLDPSDEEMSECVSEDVETKQKTSLSYIRNKILRGPIALRTRSCRKYGRNRTPNTTRNKSSVNPRRRSQSKNSKRSVKQEALAEEQDSKMKVDNEEVPKQENLLDVSRADSFLKDVKEEEEEKNLKDEKLERTPLLGHLKYDKIDQFG